MNTKAIFNTHPNVVSIGDNQGCFDKDWNKVEIDQTKYNAEVARLEKELKDTKYQRDRASDYPPLAEQMDLLYHGGLDALKAELKKTKDKFPKPE